MPGCQEEEKREGDGEWGSKTLFDSMLQTANDHLLDNHMHNKHASHIITSKQSVRESGFAPTVVMVTNDNNKLIHLDPVPDFKDRADIKPWLQKIYYPQGIELVIERSDNVKVVFKCKAAKRKKNNASLSEDSAAFNNENMSWNCPVIPSVTNAQPERGFTEPTTIKKKKRSVSRFNTCPFRIRATFSVKRKKWNVVIINNSHSHPLKFNPDSDEYKKFKDRLRATNDIDAVKKFDELEYKTRHNLPIEPTIIPCDCGLTNEIESFDMVLPTTSASKTRLSSSSPSSSSSVVSKPKKNYKKKASAQSKENLLRKTTTQNFLSQNNSTEPLHVNISADTIESSLFLDQPYDFTTQRNNILPLTNSFTDLNEIDFTEVFNKPKHNHNHRHSNDVRIDDNTIQEDDFATSGALFSPITPTTVHSNSNNSNYLINHFNPITNYLAKLENPSTEELLGHNSIQHGFNMHSSPGYEKHQVTTILEEHTSSIMNSDTPHSLKAKSNTIEGGLQSIENQFDFVREESKMKQGDLAALSSVSDVYKATDVHNKLEDQLRLWDDSPFGES